MSPQTGSRRYTHTRLKWFMGISVFSTFPLQDFSFFYFLFSFLRMHKKHKNANKRISYFFPLRCFLSVFSIFVRLFAFCAFIWLHFCAFLCFLWFLVLFVCAKSFRKKKIKSLKLPSNLIYITTEIHLITSMSVAIITIFFSIITIFFNYNNLLYQNLSYHNLFQSL